MVDKPRQTSLPGFGDELPRPPAADLVAVPLNAPTPFEQGESSSSPDDLAGKAVWVVDAHSLIHQVFHALPEMTSPRGEPVGAVFGFSRDLLYLMEEKKPDYLFCAFDLAGKTFRHQIFDQYKAQRVEMHEDLAPQIASIRRVLTVLGIPALACESFEADDILATVARLAQHQGGRCVLVTSDKDSRQLITDRVQVYNIRKDEYFDEAKLREEWGIRPYQVVDFQALVGDAVDNVPGVPLIGPKLARQLLDQYGTLENVLDHAADVAGAKRKENLVRYRDQALLSRELVRLDANVPLAFDWASGRPGRIDLEAATALFHEFGFRSVGQRVASLVAKHGPRSAPGTRLGVEEAGGTGRVESTAASEASDSGSPHALVRAPLPFTAHLIDTPELFATFLEQLRRQSSISLDTETTSVHPRQAQLVGLSFCWNDIEAWYLPLRAPSGARHLEAEPTLAALRPILENPAVEKIGQNLKYDIVVLRGVGIVLAGVAFDTMVASYLLEAGRRNHNLDELAQTYLGHETIRITELIGRGKDQKRMDEVPVRQVADYAAEDAWLPWRLRPILRQKLEEAGLSDLATQLELPLIDVLAEMEFTGIRVNPSRLGELSRRFGERIEKLEAEIHALAGRPFNIASPKQLQELLFQELKLPVVKRTAKTGPSTDADVLEELAPLHPLPAKILQYRQYTKLKSTYVDALPTMICPATGRVHASFNQVVAATGRLSSSDPNLQNIPVRSEEGREIRSAFVPGEPGWSLLAADYSQIELRVLAHFSGDARLRDSFARDEDIHARVASQVAGVPIEQVTSEMRRVAKVVNFGVIYGQGPFGLARTLGISQDSAAQFIDSYFEGYPGIEEFLHRALAECRRTGYAKTILGRRRAISGVREGAGRQRNLAERTAVNTVIQGSAADLIKRAMIAVCRRLRNKCLSARMLLQIHDELVFEVPADQLDHLTQLVTEEMTGAWALDVPLKVDITVGPNWGEMEDVIRG
ncbi:MAG: DNA polymerase I [Thermoguttaceae bacterium]